MLKASTTRSFERDVKRAGKRGKDLGKLRAVMERLLNEESLPARFRNHPLSGEWKESWECHVEPDWLLIYRPQKDRIVFERTGSHSDLFG